MHSLLHDEERSAMKADIRIALDPTRGIERLDIIEVESGIAIHFALTPDDLGHLIHWLQRDRHWLDIQATTEDALGPGFTDSLELVEGYGIPRRQG